MRNELKTLQKIDQYITGVMSGAEKVAFESMMAGDPVLQSTVAEQQLLLQAVKRKALRAEIAAITGAAGAGMALWKLLSLILGGIGVVILAVVMLINLNSEAEITSSSSVVELADANSQVQQELETPMIDSLLADIIDSDTDSTDVQSETDPPGFIPEYEEDTPCDGLDMMVKPDIQHHLVEAQEGKTIEGNDGIVVFIPSDAFVDDNGAIVKGTVDFQLVEALKLEDMVLYNLTTEASGKMLETGGMFYVNATQNGTQLNINSERPLYVEITTNEVKDDMVTFRGEVDENGDINWVDPQPLKKYLVKVDLNNLDFLPEGFADEVHGTMPFKGHKKADDKLVDSLYYALADWSGDRPKNTVGNNNQPVLKEDLPEIINDLDTTEYKSLKSNLGKRWGSRERRRAIPLNGNKILMGTIVDKNGNPLPGINVLVRQGKKVSSEQILTDAKGKFQVPNLDEEGFTIDVWHSAESKSNVYNEFVTEGNYMVLPEPLVMSNPVPLTDSYSFQNTAKDVAFNECGINPLTIKVLRSTQMQNTFIATKEFEERLRYLHQLDDGQALLDLYVDNLEKDMHEVDAMVAARSTGKVRHKFREFEAQKLTNLEDAEVHQEQLSRYYREKTKEYQKAQSKLRARYDKMNTADLRKLQREYDDLTAQIGTSLIKTSQLVRESASRPVKDKVFSTAAIERIEKRQKKLEQIAAAFPTPDPAAQPKYTTPWYSMGWANVDKYMHLIGKEAKEVKILARTDQRGVKVYQWLNNIRTMLGINLTEGEGVAKFPKAGTQGATMMRNTICFAVAEENGQYYYSENRFQPYSRDKLEVGLKPIALADMRARLAAFDEGATPLITHLENARKLAEQAEIKRQKARERAERLARAEAMRQEELARKRAEEEKKRKELKLQRQNVSKSIVKEQERLQAEYDYMANLRCVAFPCYSHDQVDFLTDSTTESEIELPNPTIDAAVSFSPNGDGVNDIWMPRLNNVRPAILEIRKGKGGKLIFNAKTPDLSWDGTDMDGKLLRAGNYTYSINGKGYGDRSFSHEGVVELNTGQDKNVSGNSQVIPVAPAEQEITFHGSSLNKSVNNYFSANVVYPEQAVKLGITGQVLAQFDTNVNGKVSGIKIVKSPHKTMGKEVERLLKTVPADLFINDKEMQSTTHSVAVLFTLN